MEGAPTRCRAFLFLVAAFVADAAFADGTGWFTPAQTAKGCFEYAQKCAVCHGTQLQGTGGPALKGPQFVAMERQEALRAVQLRPQDRRALRSARSTDDFHADASRAQRRRQRDHQLADV